MTKEEMNIAIENYSKIREDYNYIKREIQKLMEKEIREAVSLKPSEIEINMIDTTRHNDQTRRYIIGQVQVIIGE